MEKAKEALLSVSEKDSSRAANRRKQRTGFLGAVLLIVIWCGLVYGGYYISKQYIDQAIQKVQQTNAMSVQAINERLDTLSADIKELENIVGTTGQSISSAGDIQRELNQKIELLDEQIQELKRSLEILKEAPNARN